MPSAYSWRSPVGVFAIKPHRGGGWELWFDDDWIGTYSEARMAADDVSAQATGVFEWDSLDPLRAIAPDGLSEWHKLG